MNYKQFTSYIADYKDIGSAERLLGEIGFPPDICLTADGLVTAVHIIAAVAENDVKSLVEMSGLSMARFAGKYTIPYRTVQDWCAGTRTPAEYIALLIGWEMISELPTEEGITEESIDATQA